MKVYVITKGTPYKDIVGVTLDEQTAKRVADFYTDAFCSANIEEYDSNHFTDMKCPLWNVKFTSDGSWGISKNIISYDYKNTPRVSEVFSIGLFDGVDILYKVVVCAENEERALEIASEEFAKYKAEKEI